MKEAFVDRQFRQYGEEEFGKEYMDAIPTETVEKARCMAFRAFHAWLYEMGLSDNLATNDVIKEFFYNSIRLLTMNTEVV